MEVSTPKGRAADAPGNHEPSSRPPVQRPAIDVRDVGCAQRLIGECTINRTGDRYNPPPTNPN